MTDPIPEEWTDDELHVAGAGHTVIRDARRVATAEIRAFLSSHA